MVRKVIHSQAPYVELESDGEDPPDISFLYRIVVSRPKDNRLPL